MKGNFLKNTARKQYDDIIEKKPNKIMKLSNTMNIITIICLVIGILFLILDLTKIYTVPAWLFWSPLIVFGIAFIIVISSIMYLMLKGGFVNTKQITKNATNSNLQEEKQKAYKRKATKKKYHKKKKHK